MRSSQQCVDFQFVGSLTFLVVQRRDERMARSGWMTENDGAPQQELGYASGDFDGWVARAGALRAHHKRGIK